MIESKLENKLIDDVGPSEQPNSIARDQTTYIRKITRADESEFVDLMKHSAELHEPWISPPTNRTLYRHYMQRLATPDHEGLAICRTSDQRIVGAVNINSIVRGSFLSASLGYYVGAEFQGQGYMKSGLTQVVNYATQTLGLHRLEANIQPENVRSQKLVERCGFVKEGYSKNFLYINGEWRDHVRWCFIADRTSLRPN
ncbi:MAG: GNAT family N-acetyltransferase [Pseudomonadota bacterium]